MAVELDYYAEQRGRPSRLAMWALGLGAGALALSILGILSTLTCIFPALALMGFAAMAMGYTAMQDPRRGGMGRVGFVMGLLAACAAGALIVNMVMHPIGGRVRLARRMATIAEIANLNMAIEAFKADTGGYPTTAEGLDALLVAPAGVGATWKGPYIAGGRLPTDGWGRNFEYRFPGKGKPADFEIVSAGDDGVPGTSDDIDRSTKP